VVIARIRRQIDVADWRDVYADAGGGHISRGLRSVRHSGVVRSRWRQCRRPCTASASVTSYVRSCRHFIFPFCRPSPSTSPALSAPQATQINETVTSYITRSMFGEHKSPKKTYFATTSYPVWAGPKRSPILGFLLYICIHPLT